MLQPVPGQCPICGGEVTIAKLECNACGVSIEGRFELERLSRLSPEQIHFVETFIRCEGTIKRVEAELGISYPTVRARLKEVIQALGFEVVSDVASESLRLTEEERRGILNQLDRGEITTQEALDLLSGDM